MKNKEDSRIKKSITNIFWSIGYQILSILLNFIIRSIFIFKLSIDYLGINSLFSNILSVLSLTEFGIGNAIIYSLYKPINENDHSKITGILNYYKRLYRIIGTIILILGICLIPFLQYIIKSNISINRIIIYYVLYLLNTVLSYFFVSKTVIFTADQKDYVLKKISIIFNFFKFILQILNLIFLKTYIGYLIIQICITVLTNIVQLFYAYNYYPYIKNKDNITKDVKKDIFSSIKSLFIYQFGGVVLNNTDNIIISAICGTIMLGFYSNYYIIISSIENIIAVIFTAILSTIGNFNVNSSDKQKYTIFKILDMISYWLYGTFSIGFLILFQLFIRLWLGDYYCLNNTIVLVLVVNFYLRGVLYPILCFRNTTVLFKKTKFIMIITSILNIILSIYFGKKLGLTGIVLATAVSRILTNIWFEPYVLYKDFFHENVLIYYLKKIFEVIALIIIYYINVNICNLIVINNYFIEIIIKGILCVTIVNIYFILVFFRKDEFKTLLIKIKNR